MMRSIADEGKMVSRSVIRWLFEDGGGIIDEGMMSVDGRSGRP